MALRAHAFTDMGVLAPDLNPILMNGKGARELIGLADLYNDGKLLLQPGYSPKTSSTILATYTKTGGTTAAVSNGSKVVTDSGTGPATFITNATVANRAFRGDFFLCPDTGTDAKLYVIESVDSDTQLTLKTPYEGTSTTGTSVKYQIIHRAWMLQQFYSTSAGISYGESQLYTTQALFDAGTETNTEFNTQGGGIKLARARESALQASSSEFDDFNINSTVSKMAVRFKVTSEVADLLYMLIPLYSIYSTGTRTFKVGIYQNDAGNPSTDLVDANATTGDIALNTCFFGASKQYKITFNGTFTLNTTDTYWLVVQRTAGGGTWAGSDTLKWYAALNSITTELLIDIQGTTGRKYSGGAWSAYYNLSSLPMWGLFSLDKYYDSGTNTYVSAIIDLGRTPTATATGSLTVSRTSYDYNIASDWASLYMSYSTDLYPYSSPSFPDTLTITLKTSVNADMSGTSPDTETILSTVSTLTNAIAAHATNNKRYWQITYALTSATGESTPIITGAQLTFTDTATTDSSGSYDVVGIGPYVYRGAFGSVTAVSSVEVPSGIPAGVAQYQRKLFWTTGGDDPRYWNGIAASAYNVDVLVRDSDGTDPTTVPPPRADRITAYNDKLILYRNAASPTYYTRNNYTSVTATVLTDTGRTDWPTGTNKLVGWRVYPDCGNWPFIYWVCTESDGTPGTETVTCAGANLSSIAVTADTYIVLKNYKKAGWYSTEVDPADWPSSQSLIFGDEDGDIAQAFVAWRGKLVCVFRDQVWLVSGYGPNTPWSKTKISDRGGTLSPWSVVGGANSIYWWGLRGIMEYGGGYEEPVPITDALRSIILDDLNELAREEIVSVKYRGLILWSYPSTDSNINDTTLIYHTDTGRWTQQDFGMYCPSIFIGSDNEEHLYFQDPTTGFINEWDPGSQYALGVTPQPFSWCSSYMISSSPTEVAQYVTVRVVLKAGADDQTIYVSYATEYTDAYTYVGELVPIDSAVTGRTSVNSTDTAYVCHLPAAAKGTAISIKLYGNFSTSLEILSVELDSDAQEAKTFG